MSEQSSLKLILGNSSTFIEGGFGGPVYKAFKEHLGYTPEDALWRQSNNPHWNGIISCVCYNRQYCKCAIKKDGIHFPTGLISTATQFFRDAGIVYDIVDTREKYPTRELDLSISPVRLSDQKPFAFYPYQKETIEKAIYQQRGILKISTGGGKSYVMAGIIAELGVTPTIFYVTTTDLLLQAKRDIEEILLFSGKITEVGIVGGGYKILKNITVMTVQTAIRAVGEKYKKFDEEDEFDNTDIDDVKKEIADLIHSAKLVFFDEVQHVKSISCQILADNSYSARWRFGSSATPFRQEGDDILIEACFGKTIVDINASWLIQNNFLVKPSIAFIHMNNFKGQNLGPYPSVYKTAIVENELRNQTIAKLAENLQKMGRTTLALVQQIQHGETLAEMIPNSVFVHGSSTDKLRKEHLEKMRSGHAPITISSSLPYEELIMIRHNGFIKQMEIGDLCHNYQKDVENGNIETLCSANGSSMIWSKVTQTHIHPLQNKIVKVRTDKHENVFVTENHSLVDKNLIQTLPLIGNPACVPQGIVEQKNVISEINCLDIIGSLDGVFVEIKMDECYQILHSRLKYYHGEKLSKPTTRKIKKQTAGFHTDYFKALSELLTNSTLKRYNRRMAGSRYRIKFCDVNKCQNALSYFKNIRIVMTECRFSLPLKIPITDSFMTLLGLFAAEGHIKKYNFKSNGKYTNFWVMFSAKINTPDGKYDIDKRNIRDVFCRVFKDVFGDVFISMDDKKIACCHKLLYYFLQNLNIIDKNGKKRVPDIVFNVSNEMKQSFLWGHYLGDGRVKLNKYSSSKEDGFSEIMFYTSSRPLYCGIWVLLQSLNHRFRLYSHNGTYQIMTRSPIKHLIPDGDPDKRDYSDSSRIQKNVTVLDRDDINVYDISVEDCHNFIGGTVLCHNTIFDEGIDCRPLDALILCGAGRSSTRALQRVGRVIRKYTYPDGHEKTDALVYEFFDGQKYLTKHALARRKIYQTEPEFEIVQT